MRRTLKRFWFLIALVTVIAGGVGFAPALHAASASIPRGLLIAAVMLVTALPIDFRKTGRAAGLGRAIALAMALSCVAAPLLGALAGLVLQPQLAAGLLVATAAPCTLASAAVWTRRGHGNDAAAVSVTLLTNLVCFLVLPAWTLLILGRSAGQAGFFASLATKLLLCVVTPIAAAQLLRLWPAAARACDRGKLSLSLAAQCGVLTMAFVGAVESGLTLRAMDQPLTPADWLLVALTAAAVHSVLLLAGWRAALAAGLGRAEAVAVAIAGSQKTLTVGIGIALEFGGLAIFPMIAYHILQLVIDTVFVDRVRRAP
ncbi:MAG: bile acid:sodium symporter [Planctomycetota bacterium]